MNNCILFGRNHTFYLKIFQELALHHNLLQLTVTLKAQNTPWNRWRVVMWRKLSAKAHRSPDLICTNCSLFFPAAFLSFSLPPSISSTSSLSSSPYSFISHPLSVWVCCDKTKPAAGEPPLCQDSVIAIGRQCLITLSVALNRALTELCSFHFLPVLCGWK